MTSLNIEWMYPCLCRPPHRVTHPEKRDELFDKFVAYGWGSGYPPLIGYPWHQFVQLVSGSHRWAAAHDAGIFIPVVVHKYLDVQRWWGTDDWMRMMSLDGLGDCFCRWRP